MTSVAFWIFRAGNGNCFSGGGIDQKFEDADTALQRQELDIDYFGIVEAAIIDDSHRCP